MKFLLLTAALFLFHSSPESQRRDVGLGKYKILGKATDEGKNPLVSQKIVLKQGDYLAAFQTDSTGNFSVKMEYYIPCMSGRTQSRDIYLKDARRYNGKKIAWWNGQLGANTAPLWEEFFLSKTRPASDGIIHLDLVLKKDYTPESNLSEKLKLLSPETGGWY